MAVHLASAILRSVIGADVAGHHPSPAVAMERNREERKERGKGKKIHKIIKIVHAVWMVVLLSREKFWRSILIVRPHYYSKSLTGRRHKRHSIVWCKFGFFGEAKRQETSYHQNETNKRKELHLPINLWIARKGMDWWSKQTEGDLYGCGNLMALTNHSCLSDTANLYSALSIPCPMKTRTLFVLSPPFWSRPLHSRSLSVLTRWSEVRFAVHGERTNPFSESVLPRNWKRAKLHSVSPRALSLRRRLLGYVGKPLSVIMGFSVYFFFYLLFEGRSWHRTIWLTIFS